MIFSCGSVTILVCSFLMGGHALNATDLTIVDRDSWGANPPTGVTTTMTTPVPYVVIHHSYIPEACYTESTCVNAMKVMQTMHQQTNGWLDIGYSFAVGGDLRAYEGRGWDTVGAHAPSYNDKSIGICVIGDWSDELPDPEQLDVVKALIDYGLEIGKIQEDYYLVGHRQVRNGTVCPGDRFFTEIQTWDHYLNETDKANWI